MEFVLMAVGRTSIGYVNEGIAEYSSRLKHYIPFSIQEIKDVKGGSGAAPERQKQLERRSYPFQNKHFRHARSSRRARS